MLIFAGCAPFQPPRSMHRLPHSTAGDTPGSSRHVVSSRAPYSGADARRRFELLLCPATPAVFPHIHEDLDGRAQQPGKIQCAVTLSRGEFGVCALANRSGWMVAICGLRHSDARMPQIRWRQRHEASRCTRCEDGLRPGRITASLAPPAGARSAYKRLSLLGPAGSSGLGLYPCEIGAGTSTRFWSLSSSHVVIV